MRKTLQISLYSLFFCLCAVNAQTAISTENELRAIASNLSGNYVLANDIVLTQSWQSIGIDAPFTGVFDGGSHTIYNLQIVETTREKVGLFAQTENATIKNLAIANANISAEMSAGTTYAAALIGAAKSTTVTNICISSGQITCKGWAASLVALTLDGGSQPTIIKDCYSDATVVSTAVGAGGIAGSIKNAQIVNCLFAGDLQANLIAGGIVGATSGTNSVASCAIISPKIKGTSVKRIIGQKTGTLNASLNYARADLGTGSRATFVPVPKSQTGVTTLQGGNIPYNAPEFSSGLTAYTQETVAAAMAGFDYRFLRNNSNGKLYRAKDEYSFAAVWVQAIYFDMALNAYKRTNAGSDLAKIVNLFNGNKARYANFDWNVDKYPDGWFIYDDIMWWVIALARGYETTNNQTYLILSKSGFERVWSGSPVRGDNGSYDDNPENGIGGMFWAWDRDNPVGSPHQDMGKMACINYPTVVAAMTLFNCTGDSLYLNRAIEIYDWARNNLFDLTNTNPMLLGRVADSRHGTGNPAWIMHVYNQATCIGAAAMLYKQTGDRKYLEDAVLAADYTKNTMSVGNGFMHFENGVEQGIYHAIFAQYIAYLIYECGQYQYLSWLRYNMDYAWENRLAISSNDKYFIVYKDYANPAPAVANIESYDASGVPALMQLIPPAAPDHADEIHCKNRNFYEKTLGWDFENCWQWSANDSLPKLNFQISSDVKEKPSRQKNATIFSRHSEICISVAAPAVAEIYNASGLLCCQQSIENQANFAFPKGLYIVKTTAGNVCEREKVLNK